MPYGFPSSFSPPSPFVGTRSYPPRRLEFSAGLAALSAGAASLPKKRLPKTGAGGNAAGRLARKRGAPAGASRSNNQRAVAAALATTPRGGVPPWAANIGLPPSALVNLPPAFQASQMYQPANLPGGGVLNLGGGGAGRGLDPRVLATLGGPGTGTGLGGVFDFVRKVGRELDPTRPGSIVNQRIGGGQPAPAPAPAPVPIYQGVAQSFVPQSNTQKYLMAGAVGLAGVLVVMQLRKK